MKLRALEGYPPIPQNIKVGKEFFLIKSPGRADKEKGRETSDQEILHPYS